MLLQIRVHTRAKFLLTQVRLQHSQHGRRFAISDSVEQFLNLSRCLRRLVNRPCVFQRIHIERAAGAAYIVQRIIPFRLPLRDRLAFHPRGKAFIEPNVVPPLHGNQIAKPLVRHFVRNYAGNFFLQSNRSLFFVDQQNHFPERNASGIFHRACGKIRQANQVQLSIGILDPEIFVVVVENVSGRLQRKPAHLFLPWSAVHADGNAIGLTLDVLEVADHQRREIRRHLRGRGECHRVRVPGTGCIGNDLLVRDRDQTLPSDSGDVERGLVVRFVKRREGASRVGGFKLRRGILAAVIVFSQIKAAHFAVQRPGVGNVHGRRTGCQRLFDRQHCHLFFFFRSELRLLCGAAAGDANVMKVDVDRVQRDLRRRLQHMQRDGFIAFEGGLLEVRRELQFVIVGSCHFGQALRHSHRHSQRKECDYC